MFAPLVAQGPGSGSIALVATLAVVGFLLLVMFLVFTKYFGLWIQAKFSEAKVSLIDLVGMTVRKVNPNIIVRSKIMAIQAGLSEKDGLTTRSLEAHYLAGGNVPNVVRALIAANRADIPLSYKRAAAIDLAGRNVLDAVQTSVNPKVIDCPDPTKGRQTIDGIAKRRDSAQGQGPRHGPNQHRPPGRRSDRGDDHRPSRRGDRHHDRLGRIA